MRILIDTHILLWCLEDSPKLTAAARRLIEDPDNEIYVSKATAWEAVKPVLLAAIGGGVVSVTAGCSSFVPTSKTQTNPVTTIVPISAK